ncbi:thiamine-monophosphate kinase [Chitiniphilus shinanonensis]|uniref:Thiamine-monophosphate kinase n=1 Tax=Chitiniphilus shinanonensis TaxID=553088 RepID=A0ABQ6BPX0_9NEIS|nr:thiamine-phosphate kinase [Chitiniphilus shinanonensis]GLS03876.1 thiamine-monophosphate kinase [Chitiniphilus shinanonensis]
MNEFELIARYFNRPARRAILGVGDDAALLAPEPGMQLAVSADMLVEGRHFFPDVDPEALGHKALAVNLSDLAAMGADPSWCTLSLALPCVDEAWLAAFARGFHALADEADIELVGGDTTRGPLTIAVQVAGAVPAGQALLRSGGTPGDDVWVSGTLGAAAAAVAVRNGDASLPDEAMRACLGRLDRPTPRLALGRALRGLASAALDISDGLLADLGHIGERSACGAELDWEEIPAHPALASLPEAVRQQAVLAGGDDYELCFTAPALHRGRLQALSQTLGLPLSRIGRLVGGQGVRVFNAGQRLTPARAGFDHFAA